MLRLIVALLVLCGGVEALTSRSGSTDGVQAFINRILARGDVALAFTPRLILLSDEDEDGVEWFEIDGDLAAKEVILTGTSGPALTAAVGEYFRSYLGCDIHWQYGGDYQLATFPKSLSELPIPSSKKRTSFMSQMRYYQNTCTASYSFAWRNWTEYEQEIDWMAFNGINMPLAFTGQEFIWQQLYSQKFGVSKSGLDDFFSGPGFMAWQRMSNLKKWAGPLPQHFIDEQFAMQKQILARYQELGINPVLPAFNGVVPEEMTKLYPSANITQMGSWCDFPSDYCCPFMVQPTDPLFLEIGKSFLELQASLYGPIVDDVHVFNADTFNENTPVSNASSYLAASATAVFDSMRAADPKAIWLMQGWLFVEDSEFWTDEAIAALLSGVPDDGMIILDLTSDEVPMWPKISANKKQFIWCMLHNYGGARAMYGNLTNLAITPRSTNEAVSEYFVGTGMTMEAIDQNPIVYEFMAQMAFQTATPVDTWSWTQQYAARRYGLDDKSYDDKKMQAARVAWKLLLENSYSGYAECYHPTCPRRTIITTRPLLNNFQETSINLAGPMVSAWHALEQVDQIEIASFRYDLVDVARQCISNLYWDLYVLWSAAYSRSDVESFDALSSSMLRLIVDWDRLLATHEAFLLGRWINSARSWASSEQEADLLEFNARNQLTLWGPHQVPPQLTGDDDAPNTYLYGKIIDYAAKNWAGLARGFYLPRWNLFFEFARSSLVNNQTFPMAIYAQAEIAFDERFDHDTSVHFETEPVGDVMVVSRELQAKYGATYVSVSGYTIAENTDVPGEQANLVSSPAWTDNLAQLQFLCDADPACKGFSTTGFFKSDVSVTTATKGVNLFVKKN